MSEPDSPAAAGLDPAHELPGAADAPADELARLRDERDQLHDRWLRAVAEFDNFRKRAQRDSADLRSVVAAEVARAVLPVLDGFDRALAHPDASAGDLRRGLELLQRQLSDGLRRVGVEPIAALNAAFDPHLHEAVDTVESAAVPDNTVIEELQKGYKLRERLVRPAMVKVARAPRA